MTFERSYGLDAFSAVKSAKQLVSSEIAVGELPTIDEVKTLADWTPDMLSLFEVDAEKAKDGEGGFDRSGALQRFAYYGAENEWSDEQILTALIDLDDRWKKYTARRDRLTRYLVPFINRARAKIGYNPNIDIDVRGLLSGKSEASTDDPIRVYGAQEFVDAEFNVDWMVKGLLAQGGIGLLVGFAGTGKTQLSLQLGATMALGLDKFLKWENASTKKRVLFMSMEMGASSLHLFMSTIIESYDDRETLNRNLLLYPLGEPLPLDTEKGQQFFDAVMDEFKPDIVILDSLQKIVSKELTDEQAVKNLFHYLSYARSRYQCAMLVIHHNRKKPNDGQNHDTTLSDVYGSTYITTDVDFVVSLKKVSKRVLSLESLKNRLGETQDAFEINRDDNLHFHLDLDEIDLNFGARDEDEDRFAV